STRDPARDANREHVEDNRRRPDRMVAQWPFARTGVRKIWLSQRRFRPPWKCLLKNGLINIIHRQKFTQINSQLKVCATLRKRKRAHTNPLKRANATPV